MNKTNTGHRMIAIENYVAKNPGCNIYQAAIATKPSMRSGHMSGYAATWRAVRAGLIEARAGNRRGTYALFLAR